GLPITGAIGFEMGAKITVRHEDDADGCCFTFFHEFADLSRQFVASVLSQPDAPLQVVQVFRCFQCQQLLSLIEPQRLLPDLPVPRLIAEEYDDVKKDKKQG